MYAARDITVIIPALNEAPCIARVVEELAALKVCSQCNQVINATSSTGDETSDSGMLLCGNDACQIENCEVGNCEVENPGVKPGVQGHTLIDRIIVCDNGSTDDTASLAAASGAIVTYEPERGYGAACLAALAVDVQKDIILFVDGDHSVVATEIPSVIAPILNGADLVIGSRTLGSSEKGALSIPQRFGNALASFLISKLWSANVTDLGPFRAITQQALQDLQMTDRKFGWTVEMQVRALQLDKVVTEVPVSTLRRIGKSKVSGTVRGVIGAGHGILGTIFKLYLFGANRSALPKFSTGEN